MLSGSKCYDYIGGNVIEVEHNTIATATIQNKYPNPNGIWDNKGNGFTCTKRNPDGVLKGDGYINNWNPKYFYDSISNGAMYDMGVYGGGAHSGAPMNWPEYACCSQGGGKVIATVQTETQTVATCEDDAAFTDAFGAPCGDWHADHREGQSCAEAGAAWGYDSAGVEAVAAACPLTCDICSASGCEDSATFTDAKGSGCGDWDAIHRPGQTCSEAGTDWGYTGAERDAVVAACPLTCGMC